MDPLRFCLHLINFFFLLLHHHPLLLLHFLLLKWFETKVIALVIKDGRRCLNVLIKRVSEWKVMASNEPSWDWRWRDGSQPDQSWPASTNACPIQVISGDLSTLGVGRHILGKKSVFFSEGNLLRMKSRKSVDLEEFVDETFYYINLHTYNLILNRPKRTIFYSFVLMPRCNDGIQGCSL